MNALPPDEERLPREAAGDFVSRECRPRRRWRKPAQETSTRAAAEAIQVHAGVGFTWEHDSHIYSKRAGANEATCGSPPCTASASPASRVCKGCA